MIQASVSGGFTQKIMEKEGENVGVSGFAGKTRNGRWLGCDGGCLVGLKEE